jgi:hypothetical protein
MNSADLGHADMDPHDHMPIEILHVLLLRLVRYFWHDAVARMTPIQKETVVARLVSLDIEGLGPNDSRLSGQTLVQYSGSLVGCDFCIIIQLAIFTLYDILLPKIFESWTALSQQNGLISQIPNTHLKPD